MRKIILSIITLAALTACASGNPTRITGNNGVATEVSVKNFDRIRVSGGMDVCYTQGDKTEVRIEASDKMKERIEMETKDNTLCIKTKKSGLKLFGGDSDDVKVYVTSPDLTGVEITGACDFEAKGHVDTDRMTVRVSGAGDVEFGSLVCDELNVSISGAGDMDIERLEADSVRFSISGAGDMSVDKAKIGFADCSIAGAGNITIKGKVARHKKHVAGVGSVSIVE